MFKKKCYALLLGVLEKLAGISTAKRFDASFRFGRKLNLKAPKTLADKVSWLSLNNVSELKAKCTDKYAVREYIEQKGLSHILVELAGGPWESAEDVDFDALPDSFALKATHGCKMNAIVADKSQLDTDSCRKQAAAWMATTYGTYSVEPHYKKIPHRLYAEKFLENASELVDYKFHCMNGEPRFVLVCSDRKADGKKGMAVTLDLFDMDWNVIPSALQGFGKEIAGTGNIRKPELFEQMKQIARQLSEDFKFVRVDLYESQGKILFGELTFTPGCCVFPYFTEQFNLEMGEHLHL